MPRKKIPKPCGCGCGDMTKGGQFIPGHDAKLLSAIIKSVGGLDNLRHIIESHIGENITLVETIRERNSRTVKLVNHICPECGHKFKGGTWGGIDAHWKSKHEDIMPYRVAWSLIQAGNYKSPSKIKDDVL